MHAELDADRGQRPGSRIVMRGRAFGLELAAEADATRLRVFIDYDLPERGPWLGRLFARGYARWCTERMLRDVRTHVTVR